MPRTIGRSPRSTELRQSLHSMKGHPDGQASSTCPGETRRVDQGPSFPTPPGRFGGMDMVWHPDPSGPSLPGMLIDPGRFGSGSRVTIVIGSWSARTETIRGRAARDLDSRRSSYPGTMLNSGRIQILTDPSPGEGEVIPMSTVSKSRPPKLSKPEPDPNRYGWRYVPAKAPDGTEAFDQVTLTLEDVLFLQEGTSSCKPGHTIATSNTSGTCSRPTLRKSLIQCRKSRICRIL